MRHDVLSLALWAALPVVTVTSRDVLHVRAVLDSLTDKEVEPYPKAKVGQEGKVFFVQGKNLSDDKLAKIYSVMMEGENVLVVVNPTEEIAGSFHAGMLPIPADVLSDSLSQAFGKDTITKEILSGLGGLTLQEAFQAVMLTQARDATLSADGIVATRRSCFPKTEGLEQVDLPLRGYQIPEVLEKWMAKEKRFFLNGGDPRLVPRGLMFTGKPGTGKTSGAAWLAHGMGVPLYRLDPAGLFNKYVGESEKALRASLDMLDAAAPCVALFDEVEKMFSGGDDAGITKRLTGSLLWWMQTHESKVLTVFTCNDLDALPPEMYRPGRIDEIIEFPLLSRKSALKFMSSVLSDYDIKIIRNEIQGYLPKSGKISFADAEQIAINIIKSNT